MEIHDDEILVEDIYELCGRNNYIVTIGLKEKSVSALSYAKSLTGMIQYSKKEREALELAIENKFSKTPHMLKLDSTNPKLPKEKKIRLKNVGISVLDICSLFILPYRKEGEFYGDGLKVVPNVIEIEIPPQEPKSTHNIHRNFLISRWNSKRDLIPEEKETLVGLMLADRNGVIDKRILKDLGFEESAINDNYQIQKEYYNAKRNLDTLSLDEEKIKSKIDLKIISDRFKFIMDEIRRGGIAPHKLSIDKDMWQVVMEEINRFSGSVLLFGKTNIYWDIKTYIHIILRHIHNNGFLNLYNEKSKIPYKIKDLKILIEKVLNIVENEIELFYKKHPTTQFRRTGEMAIEFNGDYYGLRIESNGCILSFFLYEGRK
ncbi:MAG: hypothetical protein HN600_04005 [Bacteroidetes bacterium]|nr:hypothetical protein [Bacteroidota bacterium]